MPKVLITGAGGQDGNQVANLHHLLGNNVLGVLNPKSQKTDLEFPTIALDFSDSKMAHRILDDFRPDLIFHLAAIHHSGPQEKIFEDKLETDMIKCHVNITKNILDWQTKNLNTASLFALTSKMYSPNTNGERINENSFLNPQNKYGMTKGLAFGLIKKYRQAFNLSSHAAILFNHTSIRSKKQFVFPQLALQLRKLLLEEITEISLAEPEAEIDITHSDEICQGLIRQIELKASSDLIYARGESTKISDVVLQFQHKMNLKRSIKIVKSDQNLNLTPPLIGDPSRAKTLINWQANKTPLEILIELVHHQKVD